MSRRRRRPLVEDCQPSPPVSGASLRLAVDARRSAPSRRARRRWRGRPGASCARSRTRRAGAARARGADRGSPRRAGRGRARTAPGNPDVIVHTWRSCTSTTPGADASRRPSASASIPRGVDSRRISVESRRIDHALASTSRPMRMLTSGSASTQPVARITMAAIATPSEPRRSAKTCRNAASTFRLWLPRAREDDTGSDVHRQPDERDREHPAAEHVAGIAEPHGRLDEDPDRERDEHDAVRERGEHLRALEAVAALRRRRLRREPGRDEREPRARRCRRACAPRPRGARGCRRARRRRPRRRCTTR